MLTVAARPGFEDGTLQDWSLYLLSSQEIRPTAFRPAAVGNVPGLVGIGRQEQEGSSFEVRFAFFEDGGRFVYLGLFAPEAISASLETVWKIAIQSFLLERPQGQTVAVGPVIEVAPVPEPEPAAPAPRYFTDGELGFYAKSDDLATLDPDHPVNARLRDQGTGFVPNLLDSDLEAKTALLGAGAIQAKIEVALGWYVNDDGKRMLILDPAGKIQISLHVLPKQGRDTAQILDDIQAEAEQSHANLEFKRFDEQRISALMVRNIMVDNEAIEQVHLLTEWADDSAMLRARVTADAESLRFAVNYACFILKSADYGRVRRKEKPEGPKWWQRALEFELEDRLEEAEHEIGDGINAIYSGLQTAEMYRLRWIRLRENDPVKASEARRKAAVGVCLRLLGHQRRRRGGALDGTRRVSQKVRTGAIGLAIMQDIDSFPVALRELIEAELRAGNTIIEQASTWPAPACGAYVMLENPVTTRPRQTADGVKFYERNSSSYFGEFTDSERYYFVLEPPLPYVAPDMDAIRAELEARERAANAVYDTKLR